VIAAVGPQNVEILAAATKLAALDPPMLRVDVDDAQDSADAENIGGRAAPTPIAGYRKVRTGRGRSTVMRVVDMRHEIQHA
jgi:hypothetical protein